MGRLSRSFRSRMSSRPCGRPESVTNGFRASIWRLQRLSSHGYRAATPNAPDSAFRSPCTVVPVMPNERSISEKYESSQWYQQSWSRSARASRALRAVREPSGYCPTNCAGNRGARCSWRGWIPRRTCPKISRVATAIDLPGADLIQRATRSR